MRSTGGVLLFPCSAACFVDHSTVFFLSSSLAPELSKRRKACSRVRRSGVPQRADHSDSKKSPPCAALGMAKKVRSFQECVDKEVS